MTIFSESANIWVSLEVSVLFNHLSGLISLVSRTSAWALASSIFAIAAGLDIISENNSVVLVCWIALLTGVKISASTEISKEPWRYLAMFLSSVKAEEPLTSSMRRDFLPSSLTIWNFLPLTLIVR